MNRKTGPRGSYSLTPEVHERIVTYVKSGCYVETAIAAAGICKQTFYNWLKRGAKGEEPYQTFSQAVEAALAHSEIRDLEVIGQAAQSGIWQAAAWRLERRFPQRWGRRPYETEASAALELEKKKLEVEVLKAELEGRVSSDQNITVIVPDFTKETKSDGQ